MQGAINRDNFPNLNSVSAAINRYNAVIDIILKNIRINNCFPINSENLSSDVRRLQSCSQILIQSYVVLSFKYSAVDRLQKHPIR